MYRDDFEALREAAAAISYVNYDALLGPLKVYSTAPPRYRSTSFEAAWARRASSRIRESLPEQCPFEPAPEHDHRGLQADVPGDGG